MKIRALIYSTLAIVLVLFGIYGRAFWHPLYVKVVGNRTVSDVVNKYGEQARSRIKPYFEKANLSYPPKDVAFLAMKDSGLLEVWASNGGSWVQIKEYEIQAASGKLGPKLREGDRQVPEGIYKVVGLNPNSSYHLSMKLNYPNEFDLSWARKENRTQPGSNIFIHGKAVSIGCLAMGDDAIEELFVLGRDVGISNINVIIAPTDPRESALIPPSGSKPWVKELYEDIEKGFEPYKVSITSASKITPGGAF